MQGKLKLINTSQVWNTQRRYKINETVSYNGVIYQNTTGSNSEPSIETDWISLSSSATGTTFEGSNFIMVYGNGTATENGTELYAAYELAKLTASSTNIMTVVVCPGYYTTSGLYFDTDYVNVVSLTGNCDVNITITTGDGYFSVSANNCHIKGINRGTGIFFITTSGLNNLIVENCKGLGSGSFGGAITLSGTFINCTGGFSSFGYGGTLSGTFINCTGGFSSFGYGGTLSGTFTNCTGGQASFGYGGTLSGTFSNCTSGNGSFGYGGGTLSGTFTNCTGGWESFGRDGTLSGTFSNCTGGTNSFGYGVGTLSGAVFTNCTGGGYSFRSTTDSVNYYTTGKLFYCRLTSGTFATISGTGRTYYCVDGNGNTNNQ